MQLRHKKTVALILILLVLFSIVLSTFLAIYYCRKDADPVSTPSKTTQPAASNRMEKVPPPILPVGSYSDPLPDSDTTFNNTTDFVGYEEMKNSLRNSKEGGNLTKFREWAKEKKWKEIHNSHYDWWMFPIPINSSGQGMKYALFGGDILELKKDPTYIADYLEGVELVCLAWGWNLKTSSLISSPTQGQKWTCYDIRLQKMLQSLDSFSKYGEDMGISAVFESVKSFAKHANSIKPVKNIAKYLK